MRLLLPALVLASSLTPRPITERARLADRVAVVQVVSVNTELIGGDPRKMLTRVEVLVGDVLKGPRVDHLTITLLGGKVGPWEQHVPGDATFMEGETALVLLKCKDDQRCVLTGLAEGKVQFVGDDAFVYSLKKNQHTKRKVAELLDEVRQAVKP